MSTEVSNTPGTVDLSGAPAGLDEATFDSLFPAEPNAVPAAPQAPPQQPAPAAPAAQPQAAQTPATPQGPFLKGERSVYNTPEAAIEGINQKDALIEQMRQRYALATGVDPITGQPIGQTAAQPAAPDNYYSNPQKYLNDLYAAAKDGGPQAYRDVQAKFMMDTLTPLQPMIQRMAREQAVESLSSEIKEVGPYLGSPAYQKALETNPVLKEAIAIAEADINQHSRLPGLYKIAYYAGQGQQLPEILKAQASQTQTQNQTQSAPTVRPTVQSSTPSLPATTVRPNMKSIEGIRAVIAEQEALGAKLEF